MMWNVISQRKQTGNAFWNDYKMLTVAVLPYCAVLLLLPVVRADSCKQQFFIL